MLPKFNDFINIVHFLATLATFMLAFNLIFGMATFMLAFNLIFGKVYYKNSLIFLLLFQES